MQYLSKKIDVNTLCREVDREGISFFGYYNLSPANERGDVLYLKVTKEEKRLCISEPARILLKHSDAGTQEITQTRSWNWQQGCILQWLPQYENSFIFNDYAVHNNKYISKLIDYNLGLLKEYPIAVNTVSKSGKFALGLNYSRLAKFRPDYGYFNDKDEFLPPDALDGIWYLDLENNESKLIITLEELKKLRFSSTMTGAVHKVNHIDINPSGNRFIFLHRWKGPQGRFTRLVSSDINGKNLFILNGDRMTSHCCWLNEDEILAYCEYMGETGYFRFKEKTQNASLYSQLLPVMDGHPSVSPDRKYLVTDTYPDKSRMSYLYLYSIESDRLIRLGRFYQPLKYTGEIRVDLHPKWAKDGKSIFFESGHSGVRKLYQMDLRKLLI